MIDSELMNEIQEAAAKGKTSLHGEKVCGTCEGKKTDPYDPYNYYCPDCNVTGKENAK